MSTEQTTFYVFRHAQSEHNLTATLAGHNPSPLSERGKHQAENLCAQIEHIIFDAAISSDIQRARETAEKAIGHRLPILTTSLLRERYYGEVEKNGGTEMMFFIACKQHEAEIHALTEEQRRAFKPDSLFESDEEVADRLTTFFRQAAQTYRGKTVFVMTHGNALRTFLVSIGYGTYRELRSGTIPNTAGLVLHSDGKDFTVDEVFGIEKKNYRR